MCIVSILCKCDVNNNYKIHVVNNMICLGIYCYLFVLLDLLVGLFPAEGQPWGMGDAFEGRQIEGDLSCCTVRINHIFLVKSSKLTRVWDNE